MSTLAQGSTKDAIIQNMKRISLCLGVTGQIKEMLVLLGEFLKGLGESEISVLDG